jgi:hypothetical protein
MLNQIHVRSHSWIAAHTNEDRTVLFEEVLELIKVACFVCGFAPHSFVVRVYRIFKDLMRYGLLMCRVDVVVASAEYSTLCGSASTLVFSLTSALASPISCCRKRAKYFTAYTRAKGKVLFCLIELFGEQ